MDSKRGHSGGKVDSHHAFYRRTVLEQNSLRVSKLLHVVALRKKERDCLAFFLFYSYRTRVKLILKNEEV